MRAVSLHGVSVAWDAASLPEDPLGALLVLPEADGPPSLTVRLTRRAADAVAPPRGEPWFFHGVLQVSRRGHETILDDGTSVALVRPGEVSAELAVSGGALSPFASGLVGAAMLLALRDLGLYDLHAAGVVDAKGRGVLIAGDSGAGKTTTTLALLEAGAAYVGDDRVLLRDDAPDAAVLAWPREFHVGPATLRFFPRLGALAGAPYGSGDKVTLDPGRAFPAKFRPALPQVDALVLPRVALDAPCTTAAHVDRATAFGGLLVAGAMAVLDGAVGGPAHLELLRRLASRAIALDLALGRDVESDPGVICRAIDAALEGSR